MIRHIFIKKSYKKCAGENFSQTRYLKNLAYFRIKVKDLNLKFYEICFYCMPKSWAIKIY